METSCVLESAPVAKTEQAKAAKTKICLPKKRMMKVILQVDGDVLRYSCNGLVVKMIIAKMMYEDDV
jgi:hypothetical protein